MMSFSSLSLSEGTTPSKVLVSKFELGADFKKLLEYDFVHSDSYKKGIEEFGEEELKNRINISLQKMVSKYQGNWNAIIEKEYLKALNEKEILSLVSDAEESLSYPKFLKVRSNIENRYRYISMTSADYIQASTHFSMLVLLANDL
jgi:hypothetical protein